MNEYNEPKDHFVAKVMGYLGYDAIAVGEKDLAFGLEKLVGDWKKYDLNLLCANVFRKEPEKSKRRRRKPERVFPPYRVVKRGGIKVGFLAVLSPATKLKKTEGPKRVEALTYSIEDPVPTLQRLLPEVRKKCDILVLLAHMDRSELEGILPDMEEVDLAVLGHSAKDERTTDPYLIGAVPVYMATTQGKVLGALRVSLDAEGGIADTNNDIIVMDKKVLNDEKVSAMIAAFEEENRKIQKELYAKQQLRAATAQGGEEELYLGMGMCLRCHMDAFQSYTRTAHAHAYNTLSKMYKQRDSDCIGCHSTGYGKPGGFSGVRIPGNPVDLVDVQCEACHGPGAEHSRRGKYAERAASSCTECHNEQQDPSFDFEEAWGKIAH